MNGNLVKPTSKGQMRNLAENKNSTLKWGSGPNPFKMIKRNKNGMKDRELMVLNVSSP